jgi:hypothetical protein
MRRWTARITIATAVALLAGACGKGSGSSEDIAADLHIVGPDQDLKRGEALADTPGLADVSADECAEAAIDRAAPSETGPDAAPPEETQANDGPSVELEPELPAPADVPPEQDALETGPELQPECTGDGECDDGLECTTDSCSPDGVCLHEAIDAVCEDMDLCNGTETCEPAGAQPGTGCVPGIPLDCDDGDDETVDECIPATGCQNTYNMPEPVSKVVGDDVEELVLEWPKGSAVSVEIFPAAFDPGTEVSLEPINIKEITKPLPGILIDGIAFKFLPSSPLKYPVSATIDYDYQVNADERYSLMRWNEAKQRFEPVPILSKDKGADLITFSMQEPGEYYLLYVFVEALHLKRLAGSQWETKVNVVEWPGLVLGKVGGTFDGNACQTGPDDQAGVFLGVLGGESVVQLTTPAAGGPGSHLLEVTFSVLVTSANPLIQIPYDVVLWQQDVIDEQPEGSQDLLTKFAPILQFAPGEGTYPTTLPSFLGAVTQVVTPSGRQYKISGAGQAGETMSVQGDRGATIIFDGSQVPQAASPLGGTVHGRAFDVGGGKVALVYSLYFRQSQILGPAGEAPGLHRGDVRYVVVMLAGADLSPESITFSQHLAGSTIQYLGDEEMPIWQTSSFGGGALTLGWKEALRCKKSSTEESNEEHPWVFVGSGSHALYPRKGKYKVTLPGGKTEFEETAGGDELAISQPPQMSWACMGLTQYTLTAHPGTAGLVSSAEDGYLLFSGEFGLSRHAANGLAPYGKAWHSPTAFAAEASTGAFDPGTNCYKCMSAAQVLSVDGLAGGVCFQIWPYMCQCSACGVVIAKSFLIFPKGFECKDEAYCKTFEKDALCKTGLKLEWYSDIPLNGVVKQDAAKPWEAQVLISIPYPPTCATSAENTAGAKARQVTSKACLWDTYGAAKGVCYPQL